MKRLFHYFVLSLLCSLVALGVPAWDVSPYGHETYPPVAADEMNLLLGMRPTAIGNGAQGAEGASSDALTLTDGVLPAGAVPMNQRYTFGNGSWLEYEFENPVHVGEFRLYT